MATTTPGALITDRLQLLPCTLELARAAMLGQIAIRGLLNADVAEEWPQDDLRGFLPTYARQLEADRGLLGWGIWLVVQMGQGILIGDVGFKGKPDREGAVEIGYSIVPGHRRHGYATEAARALIEWAFHQSGVGGVLAECERQNLPSIRVLTRLGMHLTDSTGDLMRWELRRDNRFPHCSITHRSLK